MTIARSTTNRGGVVPVTLAVASLALAACGGSSAKSDPTVAPATAATTTATAAPTAASTVAPTAAKPAPTTAGAATTAVTAAGATAAKPAGGKINANTATQAELQSAFEAASVPNAGRWAREVTEYRPYSASDTNWSKLRQELSKYGIADDVFNKIIGTLTAS